MTITDIYSELNTIRSMMNGGADVDAIDHAGFVSLGDDVLSSTNGVTIFGKALGDRIARIITEVVSYTARDRKIWADEITYGSALKIIHFKDSANTANTMYGNSTAVDPSQLGTMATPVTTIFAKDGVWSYSDLVISRDQIEKAFISETEMGAFLDSQFTLVYNCHEEDKVATDNVAINTAIAQKINNKTSKPLQVVNLCQEYYNATGTTKTPAQFRRDKDCLKFASQTMSQIAKQLGDKSVLYNNSTDISSNTSKDDLIIEVLTDFANDCKYNLESDVYHNDLVSLANVGNYTEINYWQGYGDTGAFADKSFIGIADMGSGSTEVEQTGIVAFIRDKKLVRSCYKKVYSDTYYNPATRNTTYFFRAEKGYLIDNAYNGVVFLLDTVTPASE